MMRTALDFPGLLPMILLRAGARTLRLPKRTLSTKLIAFSTPDLVCGAPPRLSQQRAQAT